jgi:DNA-binding transcriptional ArsR family regulator
MNPQIDSQLPFKAQIFHALSAPDRLEILEFLRDGEKCVCEIVPHLDLIQPVVSRHLKILKDTGIIRCRKDGNRRMYSLVDSRLSNVVDALTSEVVSALKKEIIEQMTCSSTKEE